MRLFDVLGPVMIGPSSSHTAGAAKIGYTAQKLLGDIPVDADIGLYGSFATTGRGHGTDRALVAGLLGLRPDHPPGRAALGPPEHRCAAADEPDRPGPFDESGLGGRRTHPRHRD